MSRVLPTPGSPTTVTSCTERCCAARSNVPIRRGFSSSRPTNGVLNRSLTSLPKRERADFARQSDSGSVFPLHGDRRELLVLEDTACRPVGLLADRDAVHRGGALDACGGVDDVAGDDPFPVFGAGTDCDDGFASVDPHPHLQVEPGIGLVQLRDRLQDPQPRPHGPLGVVLVRDRGAANGHHRIAHELLDRGSVALDLLAQASVVWTDAGTHVLRVLVLRGRGEADQVAEEDGDDLPLLERAGRLLGKRRGAVAAEGEPVRVFLATARADRHTTSLGHVLRIEKLRIGTAPRFAAEAGLCPVGGSLRQETPEAHPEKAAPETLAPLHRCQGGGSRGNQGFLRALSPTVLAVFAAAELLELVEGVGRLDPPHRA